MSVERWVTALEAQERRQKTIKRYLTTMLAFERWLSSDTWETLGGELRLKEVRSLYDFTKEDVELYVATRLGQKGVKAKATSKKYVVTAIRSFARSQRRDLVEPLSEIKVKTPRPVANPMPKRHAEAMMRYYDEGTRNHLLLVMLFRTGMRIGEVLTLRISDLCVDAQGRPAETVADVRKILTTLKIRDAESKTGHRPVILCPEVVSKVGNYIATHSQDSRYMFDGQDEELQYSTAYEMFATTSRVVGAPRTNPHSARGFYITSMLDSAQESGIPQDSVLPMICRQTGVSIAHLMHYVKPSEEKLRDLMRMAFEKEDEAK